MTARFGSLPPRLLPSLALWLAAIVVLTGYAFRRSSAFLLDADAMDTAQLARQMATGHGFSTQVLRPLAVAGWTPPQGMGKNVSVPDISHAPLLPFILAVAFAAHGGHGGANLVVAVALLGFLLGGASAGRLARLLFPDDLWAVLLSVGLYALATGTLTDAARGGPSGWAAFALCETLLLLIQCTDRNPSPSLPETGRVKDNSLLHPFRFGRGRGWVSVCLALGAALGLCFLTQYSLLLLLPLALAFVVVRRGAAGAMVCAGGFLLVTGAWLVRTALVTHSGPFFDLRLYGLMADTLDFPGASSVYRGLPPAGGGLAFFFSHPVEMVSKAARGLSAYGAHAPDVANVLVLAPALASLLTRPPNAQTGTARAFIVLSALTLAVVTAFFAPSVGTLLPFAAPACVLAAGWVFHTLRTQNWPVLGQRVGVWAWAVCAGAGVFSLFASLPPDRSDPLSAGIGLLLRPALPPPADQKAAQMVADGAVLSDAPAAVAWRTELPAVWLPRDNAAYEAVVAGRGAGPISAPSLLLTPALNSYAPADMGGWIALSQHPQAWRVREQARADVARLPARFEAKVADVRRLAQSGKIDITPAQIDTQAAEERALLPAAMARQKENVQAVFDADYGPVAEAVEDYAPAGQGPEASRVPSTLFVRRELLPRLGVTVQPDAE